MTTTAMQFALHVIWIKDLKKHSLEFTSTRQWHEKDCEEKGKRWVQETRARGRGKIAAIWTLQCFVCFVFKRSESKGCRVRPDLDVSTY